MYIPEGYEATEEIINDSCFGCVFDADPCNIPPYGKVTCEEDNVIFKKIKPKYKGKTMKKSDLKTGMIVETYEMVLNKYMVLLDTNKGDILSSSGGYIGLDEYDDSLYCICLIGSIKINKELCIKKVYIPKGSFAIKADLTQVDYQNYSVECVNIRTVEVDGKSIQIPEEEYQRLMKYKQ
jgi:hypothetical protein